MPAPSRARKKIQPAHDVMFKKMIWMNVWYILIQRSFAMLIEESEEIMKPKNEEISIGIPWSK